MGAVAKRKRGTLLRVCPEGPEPESPSECFDILRKEEETGFLEALERRL